MLRVEVVVGRDLDGAAVGVPLRLGQEGAAVLGTALLGREGGCGSLAFHLNLEIQSLCRNKITHNM